jgi:hypothetical protein
MISKKHHKRTLYSLDRKIGFYLLAAGIALFALSFLIQFFFLRGTNFKQEYRKAQYQDCIEKGNSESACINKYPQ